MITPITIPVLRVLLLMSCSCVAIHAQSLRSFVSRVESMAVGDRAVVVDSFLKAQKRFPPVEDTTAMFLHTGTANVVTVAGDHNGWAQRDTMRNIGGTSMWYCFKNFPRDARLDYKYVVNGSSWILDGRNPIQVAGGFGPNSGLQMPDYVAPSELTVRSTVPKGRFIDTTFGGGTIAKRTVRVYVPSDFDVSSRRYPVVLFHDGLDYWNLGGVNTILDNLIADRKVMPLIAVFVPAQDRVPEYRTTKRDAYMRFICDTVMMWMKSRFPLIAQPAFTAVVGASDGGHCALYQGTQRPEVFGKIAAQSSNVTSLITDRLSADPKLATDFYLDIGTYDIAQLVPLVRNLRSLLTNRGYGYDYLEVNEGHSWGNWRARVGRILTRFFPLEPSSVDSIAQQEVPSTSPLNVAPTPVSAHRGLRIITSARGMVNVRIIDIVGTTRHVSQHWCDDTGMVNIPTAALAGGTYALSVDNESFRSSAIICVVE